MAFLGNLKFVAVKRANSTNPVVHRRNKLCAKLREQIELAKAEAEGRIYAPTKLKSVRDEATGERRSVETAKRVKAWWCAVEGGKLALTVRYGAKVIELTKGKNGVEVPALADLVPTLTVIAKAVEAGELDAQIEGAAAKLREGFVK